MNLNYDALQELYDALMFGPVLSSPYAESPIDRAFKECDEKLSESIAFDYLKKLQDRIEVLERSNKDLRDNNDKLGDKIIELKKDLDAKTKENSALVSANADLSDRNAHLQRNYERIDSLWTRSVLDNMALRSENATLKREKEELASQYQKLTIENKRLQGDEFNKLKKDLDDAKKQLTYFTQSRDDWRSRAKQAENDVEDLKKELDGLERDRDGWRSRAMHAEKRYAELRKENADLSEKVVDLRKRITELQKKGDDLTKKGEDLKKRLNSVYGTGTCGPEYFYKDGMYDLWSKMREVVDSTYSERLGCFTDLCDIEDLLEWKLEDFLDEYEKWQEKKEQKETDRMRGWLANFCDGRNCHGCPLESNEYKCGCGYSFKKTNESDTRIIPDEDIKRYYEKARGCGHISSPVEGVNRAISKACEDFCKAVRDADNKITENLRKGGTLEATVEINKDLLNTVLGIKPKEEDHQLDYGDAVRVPWRDYDYMYIGPEGKHIRLFDPKTHTVVVVSVTDNLTYQGCKIILCDEDDIRKIWKDKK